MLPSLRRAGHDGAIYSAVMRSRATKVKGNGGRPGANDSELFALCVPLEPPERCFEPWIMNIEQWVTFDEDNASERATAIFLHVIECNLNSYMAIERNQQVVEAQGHQARFQLEMEVEHRFRVNIDELTKANWFE